MSKPTQDFIDETDRGIIEVFHHKSVSEVTYYPRNDDRKYITEFPEEEDKPSKVDGIVDAVLIIGAYVLFCAMYIALWLAM